MHLTIPSLPSTALLVGALIAAGMLGRSTAAQGGGGGSGGSGQGANQTRAIPVPSAGGTADSNDRMIAVTGIDMTGSAVLYVIDTRNYQLAVYQATGGSDSTQGVKLVGARRIDLDLQLFGLNDRSKYSYEELRTEFGKKGLIPETTSPTGG